MAVKYKLIYFLIIFLFYSCGCNSTGQKINASAINDTAHGKPITTPLEDTLKPEDSPNVIPKNINEFPVSLKLNAPFNPLIALKSLFPGQYYQASSYGDTIRLEAWSVKNYQQQQFPGWEDEDPQLFPYTDGNMT